MLLFATLSTSLASSLSALQQHTDALLVLDAAGPVLTTYRPVLPEEDVSEFDQQRLLRLTLLGQLYEATGELAKAEAALEDSVQSNLSTWTTLGSDRIYVQ